jgi:hypothetical protein
MTISTSEAWPPFPWASRARRFGYDETLVTLCLPMTTELECSASQTAEILHGTTVTMHFRVCARRSCALRIYVSIVGVCLEPGTVQTSSRNAHTAVLGDAIEISTVSSSFNPPDFVLPAFVPCTTMVRHSGPYSRH